VIKLVVRSSPPWGVNNGLSGRHPGLRGQVVDELSEKQKRRGGRARFQSAKHATTWRGREVTVLPRAVPQETNRDKHVYTGHTFTRNFVIGSSNLAHWGGRNFFHRGDRLDTGDSALAKSEVALDPKASRDASPFGRFSSRTYFKVFSRGSI